MTNFTVALNTQVAAADPSQAASPVTTGARWIPSREKLAS